jgi:hypothetical protein
VAQSPIKPLQQMPPMPLREVGALLVKHHGLHEGLWDVALHMNVSIGHMGQTPETANPGAMFTVQGIGLAPAAIVGPLTVNAAEINPEK